MRRSLLLLSWIAVAATVVAQTANPNCNGLRNPTDLNLYPAYSGAKGVKLEIAANAVTGGWGMNFTNHLSYNQLTTYSQSGYTSYCGSSLEAPTACGTSETALPTPSTPTPRTHW